MPVASDVRGKEVSCELKPRRMALAVRGQTLLEGPLEAGAVRSDECYWTLEEEDGQKFVLVTLMKGTMGYKSWDALLEEDEVDMTVTQRVRG